MWGEEDANLFAARKGLGVGLGVVEECVGWVEVECGELRNARRAGLCSGLRGVVRPRMKMASMIFLSLRPNMLSVCTKWSKCAPMGRSSMASHVATWWVLSQCLMSSWRSWSDDILVVEQAGGIPYLPNIVLSLRSLASSFRHVEEITSSALVLCTMSANLRMHASSK